MPENIARMFGAGDRVLHDLLEGLFHIAAADGKYHPNENAFLEEVAQFGLSAREGGHSMRTPTLSISPIHMRSWA